MRPPWMPQHRYRLNTNSIQSASQIRNEILANDPGSIRFMTLRLRSNVRASAASLLLAGTAILTLAALPSVAVAQAPPAQEKKDDDKDKGRPGKPPARQAPPAAQ